MREADAQVVLLVKAFEEADGEGQLLTLHDRSRATEQARTTVGDDEPGALLVTRARALLPRLQEQVPHAPGLLRASGLARGLAPLIVVSALVIGLASNALGDLGRIHILFAPMVGLVAWNLAVYAALLVAAVRRLLPGRAAPAEDHGSEPTALDELAGGARRAGGVVSSLASWVVERTLSGTRIRQVKHQALIGTALARYAASWRVAAIPLLTARLAGLLHLGSIVLVTATIAGMYVRGLGLAYRAGWESTFLDGASVDAVLRVTLGPAAAVLGWELPSAAPFEWAVNPEGDDAARWIHLYALTGALFVVLPRLLLLIGARWSARRHADDLALSLDAAYFRRLLAPVRGGGIRVDVVPCSLQPGQRAAESLTAVLHDLFGTRAVIQVHPSVPYGEDLPRLGSGGCLVLLFPLAQSPENEVHGRLVSERIAALADGERLMVVVDAAGYAERVGRDSPRVAERRRSWDRVVAETGVTAVHLDLGLPPPADLVARMGEGLHPLATVETA